MLWPLFYISFKNNELGEYLNTWFNDGLYIGNDIIYLDSLITLKKVDKDTANQLYHRPFNPLSIFINVEHKSLSIYLEQDKINKKHEKPNKKKSLIKPLPQILYTMKCHLHSVDDSSFGIWWNPTASIEDLINKRLELMNWVNQFNIKNLLNGEKLLDKCVELGANPEEKDYN